MLIGTYELQLSSSGDLLLPDKLVAGLSSAGRENLVCFVPLTPLRCYELEKVRSIVKALRDLGDDRSLEWIHLMVREGVVRLSSVGWLPIPETFRRISGFRPGMMITVMGCGGYIELRRSDSDSSPAG